MIGEKGIITLSVAEAVESDEIYYLITDDSADIESAEGWTKTPDLSAYNIGMTIYSRHRIQYTDGSVVFTDPIVDISADVAIALSDVDGKCDVYFVDSVEDKNATDYNQNDIFYVFAYTENGEHDYPNDIMYRVNDETFELYYNENVKMMLNDALANCDAETVKISIYSQTIAPPLDDSINKGDLWITNNYSISNLVTYFCSIENGVKSWQPFASTTINDIVRSNEDVSFISVNRNDISNQLSAINIDKNNGKIVIKTLGRSDEEKTSQMTLTANELRFDFTTGTKERGYASFGEKHAKFGNFIQTDYQGGLAFVYVGNTYGGVDNG